MDMRYIIEGGVFEFLSRVVVTDIRPDVFHHIQKTKACEINNWVLTNLEPLIEDIEDGKFLDRFKSYLEDKGHKKERLILKAASYLATKWEFSIVYQTSKFLNDIDELKQKVDEELEDYYELIGVRKIAMNQKLPEGNSLRQFSVSQRVRRGEPRPVSNGSFAVRDSRLRKYRLAAAL